MLTSLAKKWFVAALALVAVACGPRQGSDATVTPSAESYAEYIKAYTGGIVGAEAIIRIDLMEDVAEASRWTDGLFAFTPSLSGTVQWSSPSSVLFVPDQEALVPGQTYAATFFLNKVREVPQPELQRFDFGFTVKPADVAEKTDAAVEPDNGQPFRVVSACLQEGGEAPSVDIVFSGKPANARKTGLVELSGCARYYVQVKDSLVRVFFEGRKGDLTLKLDKSVQDADGQALGNDFTRVFSLAEEVPAVSIPLQGCILPDQSRLILPFRAVNLGSVEVRVVKIYEKNVLMYLQDNDLGGSSELRRSGRLVYKGDIPLDASKDLHQWNDHSIDLSKLIKQEPGAIYRIRLSFRMDQSLYGGKEPLRRPAALSGKPSAQDEATWDTQRTWYWDNDYDWADYNWEEAGNPEKPSFYMDSDRFPYVTLLSSDIGLLAEYAQGDRLWVAATDLVSAKPLPGTSLEVYDFQLQRLGTANTDANGLAEVKVSRKPFAIVARKGGSTSYLKLSGGNERSLSRFDVGGEVLQQGIKGFIYGERGVWRPGDTLHVTLLLSDKGKNLPEAHPVTLEVYTPEGQFHTRMVRSGKDGFYAFAVPTKADDPTGYWNAWFKVGGSSFHKTLHVESVKPNRLKILTQYESVLKAGKSSTVRLAASWLAGGAAADCPAHAQVTLTKYPGSPFAGFEKYSFNNPSSKFSKAEFELFSTRLSGSGEAAIPVKYPAAEGAPGMLKAFVATSVGEPGGGESFTTEVIPYSPYSAYVGIRIPDGEYLETDKDQPVSLAVVDAEGKRVSGHKLEYRVFKLGWNWWWDNPGGDLDAYVNGSSVKSIGQGRLSSSADKDVNFTIRVDYPDWGRYLVLVEDETSGHVSGRIVNIDWPEYRGRASRRDPDALTMLSIATDKPAYRSGEKATVYIPAAPEGQALVSLENAAGVLQREWVGTSDKDTPYSFTVTPEMAPNFYVHVTLVQPHGATVNDLPLRLYGVQRVKVENPDSHLEPVVKLPDVIHPEESFTVKVSEKSGKPMTYTLAIVDEGLLDLTAFKTPDPWSQLYKDEALGVKTWDLYDQVVGAFSGRFAPLAAIGGDQENLVAARKDNRFNPVVLFVGPRTVTQGSDALKLKLPQYVGSVRVMVVAGHEGAYGSTDKTVPVQSPLMIVSTLPRVLSDGEAVTLPVNVFAMDDKLKEATVKVKVDGPVELVGSSGQTVKFPAKGDRMVCFGLKAKGTGLAHVSVEASGAGHKAAETIALEVRHPNPEVASVKNYVLQPGESIQLEAGDHATLQLSGFPALDARSLFIRMRDYPYECGEQLASRGLTLLHLLPLLDAADAAQAREMIPQLIRLLYARQKPDGGFCYWSGSSATWVSSLAGQFLTEAHKAGFEVNPSVLKNWQGYQKKMSQVYRLSDNFISQEDECYRLYTMAVAGKPESAAMNRLKESRQLKGQAAWTLISAFALSGRTQAAEDLLKATTTQFEEYTPDNPCFGSAFRDKMAALDALALTGHVAEALPLAREALERNNLSTQESAFAAMAFHHLYEKVSTSVIKATLGKEEIVSPKSLVSRELQQNETLTNSSDGPLYVTLVSVTRAPAGTVVPPRANGVRVDVAYYDDNGVSLNPAKLQQGVRITAVIKVSNLQKGRSLHNLALTQLVPSGWEIQNDRLLGAAESDSYDHKDIRDDRVNWFFDLPEGKTKTFTIQYRAAYEGVYTLPSVTCEAMYEPAVNAATGSGLAAVTR